MRETNKLPNNIEGLRKHIQSISEDYNEKEISYKKELSLYKEKINFYKDEIDNLNDLVRLLRRQKFAPKSESISAEQLRLFNEAELDAKDNPEEKEEEKTTVKTYKRGKPKRKPLPDFLPREEVVIELSEDERRCPHDGSIMEKIGEEVSEQLDIIPAQVKVIRTVRITYGCGICNDCIKTAPVPVKPIPKGIATAGLLSFIAISKYQDGLPLYRIENILQRNKVDIPRSTLSHWMIKVSGLLVPLCNLMNEDLVANSYISCDETTVQVLKEKGKKATTKSYMWVRGRAGPRPIIMFEYDPTRSSEVPMRLLEDFKGYLQVDGYNAYNKICNKEEITRVGCWAHVRRKFYDASKASKRGKNKSEKAINMIKRMYEIEKEINLLKPEEKLKMRQEKSKAIVDDFRVFIDEYLHEVPPKSLLGKALLYAHNEWKNLTRYLDDGILQIDNNFIENAIRPFAIGRKNWLFSDSVDGANASAAIYSIIETAKANGHEPYSYLRYVLNELPKADSLDDFEKLLPYNLKPVNLFQDGVN